MQFHTRGFVLHVTRYAESGAVVKIYTEQFGLQSYMVKGLFSKKSKLRSALFGRMNLLDLVVDKHEKRSLNYIKEASLYKNYLALPEDMSRMAVLMFINELLYKCIREEEANFAVFRFIEESISLLDNLNIPVAMFHLKFMLNLTSYLGFAPRFSKTTADKFFDMEEGIFMDSEPLHRYFIGGDSASLLEKIQITDYHELNQITEKKEVRNELLMRLIDYYRLHIPEMGEMKTVGVLHEVLS